MELYDAIAVSLQSAAMSNQPIPREPPEVVQNLRDTLKELKRKFNETHDELEKTDLPDSVRTELETTARHAHEAMIRTRRDLAEAEKAWFRERNAGRA